MLKTFLSLLSDIGLTPELLVLILILIVLSCGAVSGLYLMCRVFFLANKAYVEFNKKQAKCDGIHENINLRIDTVGKVSEEAKIDSKEALSIAKKVEACTEKIVEKVDTTIELIEDKYKNAKEEKNTIKTS